MTDFAEKISSGKALTIFSSFLIQKKQSVRLQHNKNAFFINPLYYIFQY